MDTDNQIYRNLQKFLDTLPGGFSATESGVDIRLLKYLFTPEEARIAQHLSVKPKSINSVYSCVKKSGMHISIRELRRVLDRMLRKGILRPNYEDYDEIYYSAPDPTAGGMLSVQLDDKLTEEFVSYLNDYINETRTMKKPGPKQHNPLRTVPIEESVPHPEKFQVSTYDSARRIIESSPGPFAVANCICRQKTKLAGGKCTKTNLEETCLMVGPDHARHYVDMGIGRFINKEEIFDILAKAQKDGLVLQPENSQKPEAICVCCGDCCVFLKALKQVPRPIDMYLSNYYAKVDYELCDGCGICVERCQLEARTIVDSVSVINLDRCIGCGNCVALCPSNANELCKKIEEYVPPKDKDTFFISLLSARQGK
jgi:electron transport complex protein RnfB